MADIALQAVYEFIAFAIPIHHSIEECVVPCLKPYWCNMPVVMFLNSFCCLGYFISVYDT